MSMGNQFNVTPEQLHNASMSLQNSYNNIESFYNQAYNTVQSISGAWGGDAQKAYEDWFNHFNKGHKEMMDALQSFINATQTAAQAYSDTESAVKGMFNR
ncbi:WXG100 family type VII secretion target [Tumebacillus sp. ITR2]|uniref:ESAT-6-like protein n=1 Tax=Tumebacillus amylolyticus TaxID=2801339 RepID=A0ABS1J889_9BACL|nr:WXG100 family type VII secretion target [Tumebacillus amylolyticus]MBL0385858.1 WXG100 family type VII secretion target [Tumebacillus amylolyticus]